MNLTRMFQLLPLILLFGTTFAMAGLDKLLGGGVPGWFSDQFGKTFLADFPGLTVAFYSIAILETGVVALLLVSILRGELWKTVRPLYLELALLLSALVFCQLGFGLRLVAEFAGAHSLFMYAVGTAVAYLYLREVTKGGQPRSQRNGHRQGSQTPAARGA